MKMTKNSVTLLKSLWQVLLLSLSVLYCANSFAQENPTPTTAAAQAPDVEAIEESEAAPEMARANPDAVMEEIVVEEERVNIFYEIDPVRMERIRSDNGRGAGLYAKGKYKEAFPHLLSAAEAGFKVAQARVSFLYQRGLGVPADAKAAIGWIGAAASRTTHQSILNYYKNFISNIPEEHMPAVELIVAEYVGRYGSRAVGMNCSNARIGGYISRLKCDFKDEYAFRNVFDNAGNEATIQSTGFTTSAPRSINGSGN